MQTHRAYMGVDTGQTCWVRLDGDKRDLAGHELTVRLFPYGSTADLGDGIAATSPATGKVTFTVTDDFADSYLAPGVFRFAVESDSAGVIYDGLLEVV